MDDPDRDLIDVSDNPAEQHLAYCRELALARCPELTPADFATAFRGDSGAWNPADDDVVTTEAEAGPIWNEVMERMIDAVEALEQRLDRLESATLRN